MAFPSATPRTRAGGPGFRAVSLVATRPLRVVSSLSADPRVLGLSIPLRSARSSIVWSAVRLR
jgi:hypothetical protein